MIKQNKATDQDKAIAQNKAVNIDKNIDIDVCMVNINNQTMQVHGINGLHKIYIISTAINGSNNQINSYGTPIGKHIVCEKIGANAEIFTIFKAGKSINKIYQSINQPTNEDLILSRILRLKGQEAGINQGYNQQGICVDSYQRYIYIHGTNREDLLGTPASHGCIRMSNHDIIELFENIKVGAIVNIINN